MTTSEPTTAEIVAEFKRITSDGWRACTGCDLQSLLRQSIARLEQLERDNAALAARAEQAEKERDAAVAEFDVIAQDGLCEVCFFGDFSEVSKDTCMEDCCFQWRNKKRVLKQEGDGERCQVEF